MVEAVAVLPGQLALIPELEPAPAPKLLDLFAGPGGATRGYQRAGFDVTGVDMEPWACYPADLTCHTADAMAVLRGEVPGLEPWRFDAIHASPPCQRYSRLKSTYDPEAWPDLLGPTLDILRELGKPYIVENVPGSVGSFGMLLCGSMFDGLKFARHRYFATGFWDAPAMAPHSCNHSLLTKGSAYNYGKRNVRVELREYLDGLGMEWQATGDHEGRKLKGMVEAIPPAYTEWLGRALIAQLRKETK